MGADRSDLCDSQAALFTTQGLRHQRFRHPIGDQREGLLRSSGPGSGLPRKGCRRGQGQVPQASSHHESYDSAIFNHRQLLNPFKFGLFSIQLFSHKLCKFLVPFFLLGLLVSNFLLISKGGFFLAAAFAQLAFYAFAGLGGWMAGRLVTPRIATACASFIMVNLAIVWAWAKYAQGETYTTWLLTKR